MTRLTHRLALRAAAKVAFSVSMIGCGGSIQESSVAEDSGAHAGEASVTDATAQPLQDGATATFDAALFADAALACQAPLLGVDASVSEDVFTCCLGVVAPYVSGPSPDASAAAADPAVVACCNAIVLHVDQVTADYGKAASDFGICCPLVGDPLGPACTPWGPPVPPSMPDEMPDEVA